MFNQHRSVKQTKRRRERYSSYLMVILILTATALAGCGATEISGGEDGGDGDGGAGPPEEAAPTEEAAVQPLTIEIKLEDGPYCTGRSVNTEVTVEGVSEAETQALTLEGERLLLLWNEEIQHPGGGGSEFSYETPTSETTRTPQFRTDTEEGTETIIVSVEMVVEDTATGVRTPVASGEGTISFETQSCHYEVTLLYSLSFSDDSGDVTETATMDRASLALFPPALFYDGEGEMVVSFTRKFESPEVKCETTEPWEGTSIVVLTGEVDEEADKLTVFFDFKPGSGEGGTMVCTPAVIGEQPLVVGEVNPAVWGLEQLEFPLEGGDITVPVKTGLFGVAGNGAITVEVERLQ